MLVTNSLLAVFAVANVSSVAAQSKPRRAAVATPIVVNQGQEAKKARVSLAEAIELLQGDDKSKKSRAKALAMLKQAMKSLEVGDYAAAKYKFDTAKQLDPATGEVWAYVNQGDGDPVIVRTKGNAKADKLVEYYTRLSDDSDALVVRAKKAAESGDMKKAQDFLRAVTVNDDFGQDPKPARLYRKLKKTADEYKKAKATYDVFYTDETNNKKKAKVQYDVLFDDETNTGAKAKAKTIYGAVTDEEGRFVVTKRGTAKAPTIAYRYDVEGSAGGGDGDVVEAINGVRAELRAIRKLMERAHREMDDDDDGAAGRSFTGTWLRAVEGRDAPVKAPKGRWFVNKNGEAAAVQAPGGVWVDIGTEIKKSDDGGTWIQLAPKARKVKTKAKKDAPKARDEWNSAIGLGGGVAGGGTDFDARSAPKAAKAGRVFGFSGGGAGGRVIGVDTKVAPKATRSGYGIGVDTTAPKRSKKTDGAVRGAFGSDAAPKAKSKTKTDTKAKRKTSRRYVR